MSMCSKKFFNKFLFFSAFFLFISFCYHHSESFFPAPTQKKAKAAINQIATERDCEHVQTQQRKIILSLEKIEDNLNAKILKE